MTNPDIDLFDTHTHLDAQQFRDDQKEVIARAREAGVSRFVTIGAGFGLESSKEAIAISERYPRIWASTGVHPHDATLEFDLAPLRELARHERVVAIGETGLDFYRDWSPREAQYQWFEAQVQLALEINKPLIIHSRSAGKECLEMVVKLGAEKVGGVFHCFSEDAEFAARLRELNFMVSIPGNITYKKADDFREIVKKIPIEQIMLETDAPYLAPMPHRGKRCESAQMVATAECVAEIKGISIQEVAERTTANALEFYRLAPEDQ